MMISSKEGLQHDKVLLNYFIRYQSNFLYIALFQLTCIWIAPVLLHPALQHSCINALCHPFIIFLNGVKLF